MRLVDVADVFQSHNENGNGNHTNRAENDKDPANNTTDADAGANTKDSTVASTEPQPEADEGILHPNRHPCKGKHSRQRHQV
jgi:hypothetical protein